MGRRRAADLDLPRYMTRKGDSYYFVTRPPRRQWIPLGDERALAMAEHALLLAKLGYGSAAALLPSEYSAGTLMALVKRSARSRRIDNRLTIDDLDAMIRRAMGRCEVSGIAFSTAKLPGQRIRVYAPSVDRRDSAQGYSRENCRLVCAGVNVAMNRFGDAFLAAMRRSARSDIVEVADLVEVQGVTETGVTP